MPTPAKVAVPLFVALLLGCDCHHKAQFQIRQSDDVLADTTDLRRVADVVANAATSVGLRDYSSESLEPGTIAFYREPFDKENPRAMWVGARSAGGQIVVDVVAWNPGCEGAKRSKFNRLVKSLEAGLSRAFGGRFVLTQDSSQMIRASQPNPVTERGPESGVGCSDWGRRSPPDQTSVLLNAAPSPRS